jgi:transposase
MDFFAELIEQDPDITLVELRDALETAEGVVAHLSSIGAAIAKQGYRYKKRPYRRGARQARGLKGAAVLDQRTPSLHA